MNQCGESQIFKSLQAVLVSQNIVKKMINAIRVNPIDISSIFIQARALVKTVLKYVKLV